MSPLIVGSGSSGSEGRSDRFGLPTGTSDPGTAEAGDLYYKTDTNKIRYYDGSAWADLASGGGGGSGNSVTGLISHSMRLSDDRIGYLYRTPSSAGNGDNWTFSAWIKYDPKSTNFIFGSGQQGTNDGVYTWTRIESGKFVMRQWVGGVLTYFVSDPVFRDPSAWYHLVMSYNSGNATADDRFIVYINGDRITDWETRTNPGQNVTSWINSTKRHQIGLPYDGGSELTTQAGVAYDGMMADIYLIDGQTLDPTAFAETDSTYGHWNPIAYTGTYGTNGFHIDMGENSYVGYDSSGAGNHYTAYKVFKNWVNGTSGTAVWNIIGDGIEQQSAPTNGVNPSNKYYLNSGNNGTLSFYPSIKAKTSIEFYAYTDGATGATVSADGGAAINITGGAGNSWNFTYHNLNVTELSELSVTGVAGGTFQVGGFRVDGVWYPVGHYSHKVDIITDSPTANGVDDGVGGNFSSNYAILNTLDQANGNQITVKDGGYGMRCTSTGNKHIRSSIGITSGKFYWEVKTTAATPDFHYGLYAEARTSAGGQFNELGGGYLGGTAETYGYWPHNTASGTNARWRNNGTDPVTGLPQLEQNQILMFAYDYDNGKIWLGINGTWFNNGSGVGNPAAGAFSLPVNVALPTDGTPVYPTFMHYNTEKAYVNFGQQPFVYPAPTGFKCLCADNMTIDIDKPTGYFASTKYTGNGSTQTITTGFTPAMVWIKESNAFHSAFTDTIRGAYNTVSSSRVDIAENSSTEGVSGFPAGGFSLSGDGFYFQNRSAETYYSWAWKGGSAGGTANSDGTRASTVSANLTSGFSVVTYNSGASGDTIGHGTTKTPAMIWVKNRTGTNLDWMVWTRDYGSAEVINLNNTGARSTSATNTFISNVNSSTFTIGSSGIVTGDCVAYVFSDVPGFCKVGYYTGTLDSDGAFINTGFRPSMIIYRREDGQWWFQFDKNTYPYNNDGTSVTPAFAPNLPNGLFTTNSATDILSNGFKLRINDNASNDTNEFLYIAIAEFPFKYARGR